MVIIARPEDNATLGSPERRRGQPHVAVHVSPCRRGRPALLRDKLVGVLRSVAVGWGEVLIRVLEVDDHIRDRADHGVETPGRGLRERTPVEHLVQNDHGVVGRGMVTSCTGMDWDSCHELSRTVMACGRVKVRGMTGMILGRKVNRITANSEHLRCGITLRLSCRTCPCLVRLSKRV